MANRFDRFTEQARQAIALAQGEAIRLGHGYTGTEHLLLAMLGVEPALARGILTSLGTDLAELASALEAAGGSEEPDAESSLQLSASAKRAVNHAVDEHREMPGEGIGTEHLLLGLLREEQSTAATVLANAGVTLERARGEVRRALSESQASHRPPPASRSPRADLFGKFTERARAALTLAQEEAQRYHHNFIDTEHLLLGLIRQRDSVAVRVLANLDLNPDRVRDEAHSRITTDPPPDSRAIGLLPGGKRTLELATDEARQFGHDYIGTEHLLLGLLREGDGTGAGPPRPRR